MFPVRFPWPTVRPFNNHYRCFSISMFPGKERQHVNKGGKIIMPPSALDQLSQLNIPYPMTFKVTNKNSDRSTHCGVLEFVAEEGKVFMPYWMMQNLLLQEGGLVRIETADLPKATFSKFQPITLSFLEITNPKAILENALRHYACLTTGDVIAIHYNDNVYEINVLETKPGNAVCIIECDMNVDFAAPVGYTEELKKKAALRADRTPSPVRRRPVPIVAPTNKEETAGDGQKDLPAGFVGQGQRLDGKASSEKRKKVTLGKKNAKKRTASGPSEPPKPAEPIKAAPEIKETTEHSVIHMDDVLAGRAGIPDYDWKIGSLHFMPGVNIVFTHSDSGSRKDEKKDGGPGPSPGPTFSAFSGAGHKLKGSETK